MAPASTDDNHWLMSAALVTSSIIAVTANSFLLLIFCRRRGLRTVPNRFVINLLVTNLLSSLLLIPLLIVDQETVTSPKNVTLVARNDANSSIEIKKIFIEEDASNTTTIIETSEKITFVTENDELTAQQLTRKLLLCYFAQGTTSFVCTLSILSILLIGINMYFGVIHSLRYHFYINKCRSMAFIVTTWLVALLFSVLSCLTHSDSSLWRFCKKMPKHSDLVKIFNTIYAFSYFIFIILAPFVAICVIYVCIYAAAHQNSERMRQSTSANLDNYIQVEQAETPPPERVLPKVHSAPNFRHYEVTPPGSGANTPSPSGTNTPTRQKVARTCSDRNNFISTLKHKISNASVFRYREETRAAKISILVIFLVLFCYVPYGIALVLNSELVRIKTWDVFNNLSLILLVFSNIISPFLFAYRNKRVKREIAKLFGLIPQRPSLALEKNNRRPSVASSRNRSFEDIREGFLTNFKVPEVIVTCKIETQERKSILKRVGTTWTSYKKCNFITVPDSCISGEARGSFSSASTQISSEDCS